MKLLISIIFTLSSVLSFAADHAAGDQKEGAKHHKDWNEVFKQPVAQKELAQYPDQTQTLEPAFLAQVKGSEVVLKWKPVEGVKYHLQVATDPNYKWLVANESLVSITEYTLKNLEANKQYFWRVYTQKPDNMSGHTKSLAAASSSFETAQ